MTSQLKKVKCMFSEAITPFQKAACVTAGLGVASATLYASFKGICFGIAELDDIADSFPPPYSLNFDGMKPYSAPPPLSVVEKKAIEDKKRVEERNKLVGYMRTDVFCCLSSQSLGIWSSGIFLNETVDWVKSVSVQQKCCDIVRRSAIYCAKAPLIGGFTALCTIWWISGIDDYFYTRQKLNLLNMEEKK